MATTLPSLSVSPTHGRPKTAPLFQKDDLQDNENSQADMWYKRMEDMKSNARRLLLKSAQCRERSRQVCRELQLREQGVEMNPPQENPTRRTMSASVTSRTHKNHSKKAQKSLSFSEGSTIGDKKSSPKTSTTYSYPPQDSINRSPTRTRPNTSNTKPEEVLSSTIVSAYANAKQPSRRDSKKPQQDIKRPSTSSNCRPVGPTGMMAREEERKKKMREQYQKIKEQQDAEKAKQKEERRKQKIEIEKRRALKDKRDAEERAKRQEEQRIAALELQEMERERQRKVKEQKRIKQQARKKAEEKEIDLKKESAEPTAEEIQAQQQAKLQALAQKVMEETEREARKKVQERESEKEAQSDI
eukprot:m.343521 g.343521  ORF g.343521 m.343521 type:complete len:358 (+) comp22959_c0_seq1:354-1427(+)